MKSEKFQRLANRMAHIAPFEVMEIQTAARELERQGKDVIHMEIGEPDFTTPQPIVDAAIAALNTKRMFYTSALGIAPLREAIAAFYASKYGVTISPDRIIVTAGSSAALLLAFGVLLNAGDEVLMADPGYPCNRHFVSAADGRAVLIPTTAAERFQLSAAKVEAAWTDRTRGVLLASPSNPTGTSIAPDELRRIHEVVTRHGGVTLIDEIYLGLSHDDAYGQTALAIDDQIISINSFSKYFNMTGWRLGWLVVPDTLVPVIERLAQNLFICASTVSQHAALACFEPDSIAEYERRRAEFKARRDWFIPQLKALGLDVPVMPDGAFYAWADCSKLCAQLGIEGSWDFAFEVMKRAHVAVTPGRDFGTAETHHFVRFSTASSMAHLQEAIARLRAMVGLAPLAAAELATAVA